MYPDRNRVLCLILPGLVLGLLLVCGLTGCTTGANTESTQGPGETQAQPQARDNMARELADLREKVAKLERDNEALQKKVKHLETLVKIAEGSGPFPFPPAIETVVRKVDQKEKFAILPIGRGDDAHMGMRFYISRHGAYVGEVMVFRVRVNECTATIVRLKPGMSIQVGDAAVTRL